MSNLVVAKKPNANIKAKDKDTTIISDLRSFFSKSEENRALHCIVESNSKCKISENV